MSRSYEESIELRKYFLFLNFNIPFTVFVFLSITSTILALSLSVIEHLTLSFGKTLNISLFGRKYFSFSDTSRIPFPDLLSLTCPIKSSFFDIYIEYNFCLIKYLLKMLYLKKNL